MKILNLSLTTWIFIGLFLGVLTGLVFGEAVTPFADPMAQLFLRLLRMTIIPLIITSILSGVLSIGSGKGLGRLGLKTFVYYTVSSLLAIFTGQALVNLFKPGVGATISLDKNVEQVAAAGQSISDLLLRIVPTNIFNSLSSGDVLSIIFFCILFGYFVLRLKEPYQSSLATFIEGAFRVMMKMVHFVIWFAPIGIFGINAKIVGTTGLEAFKSLGFYFLIVLVGLFWHALVSLPLLLRFVARINPLKHYKGMIPAILTAFSTSSSMAALPLTIESVTRRSRVSSKIASFTLPIGATVNMDGTALYECVATIFIAQLYGIELTVLQQAIVVLTALLASIGAAAVPMAGLVMLTIILNAVGLPLEGVGLILAVDRVLDMFRTATNVLSDSCGAVIIARSEGETLDQMGEPADEEE
ncbi:dicarboxylate/amino acid:cation symporter [candidate division KSB1 bacterium]|nr:dicarboxylate/amino acid:cation symporter [candidate division KSB1 bacterium]RQW00307.1 MAG: dicarboxylate/amino acid:cation symporter [candidate division KSB1 bacterium]